VVTNRDEWVYDESRDVLQAKVQHFVDTYESERLRWSSTKRPAKTGEFVSREIKWTSELEAHLVRGTALAMDPVRVRSAMYRPFFRRWTYYSDVITHRLYQQDSIFPVEGEWDNRAIVYTQPGSQKPFMASAVSSLPDLHFVGAAAGTECLPFWRYESGERVDKKQAFLKAIYENFYKVYNPKAADRLGVVYTPNEIVRFVIESADWLCERHFKRNLVDRDVHLLDPATGTGTFICELIDHCRGQPAKLRHKYRHELHANEVAILPYYVANLNIEATYAAVMGEYEEFPGLCFVDTLDNTYALRKHAGHMDDLFGSVSDDNVKRIRVQNSRRISVILGNPPYNANQLNENENNKNREYPEIDKRIKETYIAASTAQKTKLYDMYSRFFRWAADRLDENGVLAFITNRSFIDSRTFDGFRAIAAREFNEIRIIDLGGDVRANPKLSGTTHNVFGIQTGVAISFMVKRAKQKGCRIFYARRPEMETAAEKLSFLQNARIGDMAFEEVVPDAKHNWINLTSNDFETFLPLASKEAKAAKTATKERAIFKLFSLGVVTNRDDWVYDKRADFLTKKIEFLINAYNKELDAKESKDVAPSCTPSSGSSTTSPTGHSNNSPPTTPTKSAKASRPAKSPRKPSSTTATRCCTTRCTARSTRKTSSANFRASRFTKTSGSGPPGAKALMALHIGYEAVAPFALTRTDVPDAKARAAGLQPKAMLKSADPAAGSIALDTETTLRGIPPEAWAYKLGNRCAIDWVLDQYKEKKPKDPTIREKFDTYRFADYKDKVIDLLARVTTVSVETACPGARREARRVGLSPDVRPWRGADGRARGRSGSDQGALSAQPRQMVGPCPGAHVPSTRVVSGTGCRDCGADMVPATGGGKPAGFTAIGRRRAATPFPARRGTDLRAAGAGRAPVHAGVTGLDSGHRPGGAVRPGLGGI
jgi:predicted helicase